MHKPQKMKLEHAPLMLDIASDRIKAVSSRLYEERCGSTLRELQLMRFIGNEPGLPMKHLIELSHVEKTLASKAISALVRRKLVRRAVGATDARQISLSLTEAGVAVMKQAERIGRQVDTRLRVTFSAADRALFQRCLTTLIELGDALAGDLHPEDRRTTRTQAGSLARTARH